MIVRKKTTISKTHIGTFISLLKIKNTKDSIAPNANDMRLLVSLKYFFKHRSHPFKKDSITKKYCIQVNMILRKEVEKWMEQQKEFLSISDIKALTCQIYQEKPIFHTWHCMTVFLMRKEIAICE